MHSFKSLIPFIIAQDFYFYYTLNEVSDLEYYIGLSGYSFWKRVSGYYIQSSLSLYGLLCVIECHLEDKYMLIQSGHYPGSDWSDLDLIQLVKDDTIDIIDNGYRWEGDSLNGVPYGFGCYYNVDNILVYQGFDF